MLLFNLLHCSREFLKSTLILVIDWLCNAVHFSGVRSFIVFKVLAGLVWQKSVIVILYRHETDELYVVGNWHKSQVLLDLWQDFVRDLYLWNGVLSLIFFHDAMISFSREQSLKEGWCWVHGPVVTLSSSPELIGIVALSQEMSFIYIFLTHLMARKELLTLANCIKFTGGTRPGSVKWVTFCKAIRSTDLDELIGED